MKFFQYLIPLILLLTFNSVKGQVSSDAKYRPFDIPTFDYLVSQDIADFNNDHLNDIIIAKLKNNELQIQIKFNEGDSLQKSLSSIDTLADFSMNLPNFKNPVFITNDDIDNDGDIDFYIGELAGSKINAVVGIIENKTFNDQLFFEYRPIESLRDAFVLAVPSVVDLDKDGLKDLIVSDFNGRLKFYKNNGAFRFTEINENPLGGHQFTSSVSFVEMPSENQMGLLAYTYEEDFQFFPENPNQIGNYVLDTTIHVLRNPDSLKTKFYQPRFKDIDNDENPDLFLSALTFSESRGYYTDSWLFFSTAFGAIATIRPAGCMGIDDGQINIDMKNGVGPYSYHWINTDLQEEGAGDFENSSEKLTDLSAGNYELTVSDATGKKIDKKLIIKEANRILVQEDINGPTCPSDATGSVLLIPQDTTRNYNYTWGNGSTANGLKNVVAGNYKVTISDDNGCQTIKTIKLEDPNALKNKFRIDNCGDGEVTIVAAVENGQKPYTYQWNTADSSKLLSNRTAGIYILTVTDATGCQKIDSVVIDYIEPVSIELEVNEISCAGANDGSILVNINGGPENISVKWNNEWSEKDIFALGPGPQLLEVVYGGCRKSFSRIIQEPQEISAQVEHVKQPDGNWEISVIPVGGIRPYEIEWENGSTSFIQENQKKGTFLTFTITDKNGCTFEKIIDVSVGIQSNELVDLLAFNLYPNPTNNFLNVAIEFPERLTSTIDVYNVLGKHLFHQSFDGSNISTTLDVNDFPSGTYFLKLSANGEFTGRTFLIH